VHRFLRRPPESVVVNCLNSECLHTLPGHTSTIRCLAMTASGTVISGSRDTTLRVWNISSDTCHYVLEGHTDTVRCVVAQGMDIVSAGYDNLVKFWSLSSSVCLHTSDDNEEKIFSLAFLKAGRVVASGSLNGDVFLYNVLSHSVLGRAGYTYTPIFGAGVKNRMLILPLFPIATMPIELPNSAA